MITFFIIIYIQNIQGFFYHNQAQYLEAVQIPWAPWPYYHSIYFPFQVSSIESTNNNCI